MATAQTSNFQSAFSIQPAAGQALDFRFYKPPAAPSVPKNGGRVKKAGAGVIPACGEAPAAASCASPLGSSANAEPVAAAAAADGVSTNDDQASTFTAQPSGCSSLTQHATCPAIHADTAGPPENLPTACSGAGLSPDDPILVHESAIVGLCDFTTDNPKNIAGPPVTGFEEAVFQDIDDICGKDSPTSQPDTDSGGVSDGLESLADLLGIGLRHPAPLVRKDTSPAAACQSPSNAASRGRGQGQEQGQGQKHKRSDKRSRGQGQERSQEHRQRQEPDTQSPAPKAAEGKADRQVNKGDAVDNGRRLAPGGFQGRRSKRPACSRRNSPDASSAVESSVPKSTATAMIADDQYHEWEVTRVSGRRVRGGREEYRVHWKSSWISRSQMSCDELLEDYTKRQRARQRERAISQSFEPRDAPLVGRNRDKARSKKRGQPA